LHAHLSIIPSIGRGRQTIHLDLSRTTSVKLDIYDASGRLIFNIIDKSLIKGSYSIDLRTHDLPCGIYFVSLESENVTLTKKIILID
jgi:hypothetical protein